MHERRHGFAERNDTRGIRVREQLAIAPQGRRTGGELLFRECPAHGVQVVTHPQRPVVVQGLGPVGGQSSAIQGTFQVGDKAIHGVRCRSR